MSTEFLRNSKRMTNIPIRKLDDHSYEILDNDRRGLTNIQIRLLDNHKVLQEDQRILRVNQ